MTPAEILSFFKESTSSAGTFFPIDYIVAMFASPEAAAEAHRALESSGVGTGEMLALPPSDVFAFLQQFQAEKGVAGGVMRSLSRAMGDDATHVDRDMEHARMGAGFLFIHCSSEEVKERIREIAGPMQPVAMRWYQRDGIESLVGGASH